MIAGCHIDVDIDIFAARSGGYKICPAKDKQENKKKKNFDGCFDRFFN
jgi:hypothetical protein